MKQFYPDQIVVALLIGVGVVIIFAIRTLTL